VEPVDTTSVPTTESGGPWSGSGSEGSQPSKSGSGRTRARRSAPVTTPPDSAPPDLEAEAEALLGDKKKLYALLRKELLVAYLMECRAGKDTNANPQHSRASRKQAKELAELLARLTNDSEK
jgi:hypothetical protein